MGISPQLSQDFNSNKNDKDLTETPKVQDFNSNKKHSKIPDYAKDYKNEYLFIIGINEEFSYVDRYINLNDIENGIFEEKSKCIDKIYNSIKKI